MPVVNVPILGTRSITNSETDTVTFTGAGTLDISGTQQNPITVTLSSVAGVGLLDTINITYADVTLEGPAGVGAIGTYNIGTGGTLRLASNLGVSAAMAINFTGTHSHLVIGNGVNLSLLGPIDGFGPGSNIDVANPSVTYTYTDNSGTNTGGTLALLDGSGNTVKTVALNTGEFTASSFNVHPDGTGGTLIDFATYVSTITATPANGDLTAGGNVVLQLGTTAPVTITGGPPTLTLSDGGIATYDAASSTSTSLVFRHAVLPGQNTADLTVTGTNLNGGSVTDLIGNAVNLSGGATNPAGILQIDTTAPTVASVTTSPGSGDLAAGQIVAINLNLSEAVTVAGGTPNLTLNDGGIAAYDASSSTPTVLVFKYVVQPGQNTADLTVTGTTLNSATITDGAGNPINLAGAIANPTGILQIDTTAPTVASVTTSPASGAVAAGQIVAINVTPSEAVTVTGGTPTLTLNDGGVATYDAASSTPTHLVFDYTVQAGQNTADLTVTGINLNGATVGDGAGNVADLSAAIVNPAGVLQIDTTAPTVTSVTTSPGSGSLGSGQVVAIDVTPSEAVTVSGGTPTLTLNNGGTATYDAASSTPTLLVFKYVVQPGQNTGDLTVTGTNLNGAIIADAAGNPANLSGAVGNPPGVLQINATGPVMTSVYGVTTTPGSGDLTVGGNVALQVTLTGTATVSGGTPTLTLSDGGTATYDAATSTSTVLSFLHTVQPGQNTADLAVTALALNGAVVADGSGNAVDLSGAVVNPPGILQIDTTAPTVASVTTSPNSGSLAAGQIVAINVTPSEAVTVAGGTPTLTLNDGGTATYDAASSTPTLLVFKCTVQSGQNVADLAVTGTNLNGATIADGAGNGANLSAAIVNPPGTLQIDTTAPTVVSVTTSPGNGSLTTGQVVAIDVTSSEAVTVTGGTPTLTLNDGGTAIYDAANSTPTLLVFDYTVQPGQNTTDLTVTGTNLNGATVGDGAGNAIDLTTAVGNPPGTLQIDTTAPTIVAVATQPSGGSLAAGQVVILDITPSEAVMVSGGTPTLTLNNGGTATYDAANSTPTLLVFKYVVQPGQDTGDLTVTGTNLNGAIIADPAGNPANLSGAVGNPPGVLQINTTGPAVISVYGVTTTPGSGDLTVGGNVALQVTLTGTATVSGGTPTLTLSDGGTATYDAATSTSTVLSFLHTVQPGQNTADLAVTALALNGAVVADGSGNAVDLSGAVVNPPGILQIDTTAPTVASVTTSPNSGSLAAGQIVAINVTPSEAVTVAGGTPTLTLNDGGTATYDAASSTPTLLVFKCTVQSGQNVADLAVTGTNLNGATIADGAGNGANLSAAIVNPPGTLQIDTTAPTVVSVTTSPGNGSLTTGQVVAIDVTSSEAVTVTGGTPTLTLNDGGTAIYDAANSTPTLLVFDYTVQPGQNTTDLTVTGTTLNGASIADGAGNALDLSGAVGNPPGSLQINLAAAVTGVVAAPATADLLAGSDVLFQVSLSGPVTITGGTPALALNDGGTAVYDAANSTPTLLAFTYTVQPGENTPDLAVTDTMLNGASIIDGSGQSVDLTGAIGNPAGTLQIDTIRPTVLSVVETRMLQAGTFEVVTNFSEAITMAGGPPEFLLSNGATAPLDSSLSTPTMAVFLYTAPAGESVANLSVTGFDANGTVTTDGAGNLLDDQSVGAALAEAQGNIVNVAGTDPTTIDVYRFFDTRTGTHFYTQDQSERQTVLNTRPDLVPEGLNGVGLTAVDPASNDPNASAVYRFFDTVQGTHFFTASVAERDAVIATRRDLVYEPSSTFYEHTQPQAGDTAVYRFFDQTYGTHFYTDSPSERASILQNRPDLVAEGIGFYEPARNPAS